MSAFSPAFSNAFYNVPLASDSFLRAIPNTIVLKDTRTYTAVTDSPYRMFVANSIVGVYVNSDPIKI